MVLTSLAVLENGFYWRGGVDLIFVPRGGLCGIRIKKNMWDPFTITLKTYCKTPILSLQPFFPWLLPLSSSSIGAEAARGGQARQQQRRRWWCGVGLPIPSFQQPWTTRRSMAQHGTTLLAPLSMAPSLLSGAFPPLRPSPTLPPPSGGGGEGRVRRRWRWRRLATSLSLSLPRTLPPPLHPPSTLSSL